MLVIKSIALWLSLYCQQDSSLSVKARRRTHLKSIKADSIHYHGSFSALIPLISFPVLYETCLCQALLKHIIVLLLVYTCIRLHNAARSRFLFTSLRFIRRKHLTSLWSHKSQGREMGVEQVGKAEQQAWLDSGVSRLVPVFCMKALAVLNTSKSAKVTDCKSSYEGQENQSCCMKTVSK